LTSKWLQPSDHDSTLEGPIEAQDEKDAFDQQVPKTSENHRHDLPTWHDKKYRWIARCEGTARTALWNVDRSTGRQVDRSTGPWQVTCAVERSAVCQVHKVLEQRFNLDGSPMAAMARSRDQSETCCLEASRDIIAILCQSIAIFTDFSTYSSTGLPCYWLEWYAESHFQPANCKCCLCLLILGLKGVTMFVSHSGWFWYALVDMNCQHVLDHAETEVDLTSEMRPERCEDFAAFFRYQSSQFSQSEINLQSWTSEINLHNFHNLSHAQL